jgi:hypothetical protein
MKLPEDIEKLKEKLKADDLRTEVTKLIARLCVVGSMVLHYARLVGKPVGVNEPEENQPDYLALAKEAIELTHKTMPAFFEALGDVEPMEFTLGEPEE